MSDPPAPGNFFAWQRESAAFDSMAAWFSDHVSLHHDGASEAIPSAGIAGAFFEVAGVPAAIGRTLETDEIARQGRVIVISHRFWLQRFNGDRYIAGRSLTLDGESWRIVGVMPAGFALPRADTDIWRPRFAPGAPRGQRYLQVAARLAADQSITSAERSLNAIAERLAAEHRSTNGGWGVKVLGLHDDLVSGSRGELTVLMAAVAVLLLLACANVSNLLLVSTLDRHREIMVRRSVGASRWRIMRQLLVEGVALVAVAGILGLILAWSLIETLRAVQPTTLPRLEEIVINWRVVRVSAAAWAGAAIAIGLAPAIQAARSRHPDGRGVGSAAHGTAARSRRAQETLVVLQVAGSVALLSCAALLLQSFLSLARVEPGFDPRHLLSVRLTLDRRSYPDAEAARRFYARVLGEIRNLPDVSAAALISEMPMSDIGTSFDRPFRPAGAPMPAHGDLPEADLRVVSPGYFAASGVTLLEGRDLSEQDHTGSRPVVVINSTLARTAWPSAASPIGRHLSVDYGGWRDYEVIGVVADVRSAGPRAPAHPETFFSFAQIPPFASMNVAVRTTTSAPGITVAIRGAVHALDPAQPIHSIVASDSLLANSVAQDRLSTVIMAPLAGAACVLGAVGVHGLFAWHVRSRRRELCLRLALGARPRDVSRLFVVQSARLTLLGIGFGLAGTVALARPIAALLYGVSPSDPLTICGAVTVVLATAAVSLAVPIRRAMRLTPLLSLRPD